jgi:putative aminophosphonate oxidoreductase
MRSFWLEDCLDPDEQDCAPVAGVVTTDVCIVGGGFTGLWCAIFIKALSPSTDVSIVEADICGAGASGRNGGFVLTWAAKIATLIKLVGEADAVRIVGMSEDSVHEIATFCEDNRIDAHFRRDGWLWTASNIAQIGSWRDTIETLERVGLSIFQELDGDEVRRLSGSARQLGGVFAANAATVQPARLVRGLRKAALERGVRIFERSPMQRLERGKSPAVVTAGGVVRADRIGLAMNAWTPMIPELARLLVVVGSDIVATEPCPDLLERLGIRSGIAISDSRLFTHYYRTTTDGRMVFGKGGGSFVFGSRVGDLFEGESRFDAELSSKLQWFYPEFRGVRSVRTWSGPIDRTMTGLPLFGRLPDSEDVVYAFGYSGNGVGPSHVGGRVLASLCLARDDDYARLPLVSAKSERFPPEPFRYVGARTIRRALARREAAEDANRKPGQIDTLLSNLMPGGLVPVKKGRP